MLTINNNQNIELYKSLKSNLSIQEFINETKYDIDELKMDNFWHSIENNNIWIYVNKYIGEWMELYDGKEGMSKIYKSIQKHLIENIDYILYENFDEFYNKYVIIFHPNLSSDTINEYKCGSKAKYLIVKPESFKKWVMRIRTDKGDEVCDYFLKLENLFKEYLYYQTVSKDNIIITQQKEIEHNKELAEKEKQELKKKLDEHIKYSIKFKSSKIFIKRGYFYNISSKHLSKKGNEKTGITGNLIHRLSPYRTSSPNTEDDKLYYTDYFQVQYPELFENYINGLFDSLREDPDREFLKIRYPFLSKIIYEFKKCHDKICEYFDEEMKFMDNINNDIVWDENINFISDNEIKNIDTIMNNTPYILVTNNGIIHNITENNKDEFKNNLIKEGLVKDNNYHMIKQTLKKNGSIKCDKDYDVNIKDILSNMSTLLFNLINVKTIYNNKIYPITNIK